MVPKHILRSVIVPSQQTLSSAVPSKKLWTFGYDPQQAGCNVWDVDVPLDPPALDPRPFDIGKQLSDILNPLKK